MCLYEHQSRRNLRQGNALEQAVDRAMKTCLKRGIMADILSKSQTEVRNMLLEEYDEKADREYLRKEAIEEGRAEGMRKGMEEGLQKGLQKGMEEGLIKGQEEMIENALETTGSISQTARFLKLHEDRVRKIAEKKGLVLKD